MSWGLISEMGHVAIQTTDLAAAVADATDILGLRVTERTQDGVYLAANAVHHELVYVESSRNGIHALGLIARDGDALAEVRRRVEAENLPFLSDRPLSAGVADGA